MDAGERERLYRNWDKAVTKTLDWVDEDVREGTTLQPLQEVGRNGTEGT